MVWVWNKYLTRYMSIPYPVETIFHSPVIYYPLQYSLDDTKKVAK